MVLHLGENGMYDEFPKNMGTLIHEGNANNHSIIFCKGRRGRRTVKLSQTKREKNAENNPIMHNNAASGATHPYSISKEAVRIDSSQVLELGYWQRATSAVAVLHDSTTLHAT